MDFIHFFEARKILHKGLWIKFSASSGSAWQVEVSCTGERRCLGLHENNLNKAGEPRIKDSG